MNIFSITVHMVSSVDGFIAKKDNSVGWLDTTSLYEKGVELSTSEMAAFTKSIDCYVMGARTYELALELSKSYGWPYGDTPTIVLTHRNLSAERHNIEFFTGNLVDLVEMQLKPRFRNVWVVGGAELATAFIHSNLATFVRMTMLPILLGDGLRFFDRLEMEQALHLVDVTAYKNGMVELYYEIRL